MPKEKPFEKKIDAFYKKNCIDIMMFGWVTSITEVLPAVDITHAIEMFKKWVELSDDDYPTSSAKIIYSRIKQNFNWRTKK